MRNCLGQVGLWSGPCGIILVASRDENVGCAVLGLGVLNNLREEKGAEEEQQMSWWGCVYPAFVLDCRLDVT